jgi:hypothetical protein
VSIALVGKASERLGEREWHQRSSSATGRFLRHLGFFQQITCQVYFYLTPALGNAQKIYDSHERRQNAHAQPCAERRPMFLALAFVTEHHLARRSSRGVWEVQHEG